MSTSKLTKTLNALQWLHSKGFDGIDLTVEINYSTTTIDLAVAAKTLNEDQLRLIKRHFGPLKIENTYGGKNLTGSYKLDDELQLDLKIREAYVCEKIDPAALTEEKWDHIKEKVRIGLIEISDCKPADQTIPF